MYFMLSIDRGLEFNDYNKKKYVSCKSLSSWMALEGLGGGMILYTEMDDNLP